MPLVDREELLRRADPSPRRTRTTDQRARIPTRAASVRRWRLQSPWVPTRSVVESAVGDAPLARVFRSQPLTPAHPAQIRAHSCGISVGTYLGTNPYNLEPTVNVINPAAASRFFPGVGPLSLVPELTRLHRAVGREGLCTVRCTRVRPSCHHDADGQLCVLLPIVLPERVLTCGFLQTLTTCACLHHFESVGATDPLCDTALPAARRQVSLDPRFAHVSLSPAR